MYGSYRFKLQLWEAVLVFLNFWGSCVLILCGVQEIVPQAMVCKDGRWIVLITTSS